MRSAPYLPREKTSILSVTPLESSSLEPNKGSQLSSRSGLVFLYTSTSLQQGPVIRVGGEELDMDTGLARVAWFSVLLWGVLFCLFLSFWWCVSRTTENDNWDMDTMQL